MEQWVRVQNERDHQVLTWLRTQFDDAAIAAAARNVEHRGATGLAHYLRRELSPT